jgi:hypothetical protein
VLFLQPGPDLGQPFNGLQGSQLLGLLVSFSEMLPYDLSHQVRDAPAFLLSYLGQCLVLLGFQQKLRSM